jgi:hypothetical protein
MITYRLQFSEQEMINFFRRHNIAVVELNFKQYVKVYHNKIDEFDTPTMCIVNPHNQQTIPVSVAFEKVIFKVKNALLLDNINKLTVLEALKNN